MYVCKYIFGPLPFIFRGGRGQDLGPECIIDEVILQIRSPSYNLTESTLIQKPLVRS